MPFNIPATYEKYIGRQPVLDTAASGAMGTALGYTGANVLLNPLIGIIAGMTKADPDKVRRVQQALKSYGGLAGGLAGLTYGTSKHADPRSGLSGFIQSMTDSDYWKKNPAAVNKQLQGYLKNMQTGKKSIKTPDILGMLQEGFGLPTQKDVAVMDIQEQEMQRLQKKRMLEEARSGLAKQQSEKTSEYAGAYDATAGAGFLPMDYAMSVITSDPFLSMGQKVVTGGIMEAAEDPTDAGSLMQSALRFGAAAVPAYLFGRGLSNMMGLEPDQMKTLSSIGGVAAGILNTGIFGDN